jgi:hypothetical protein
MRWILIGIDILPNPRQSMNESGNGWRRMIVSLPIIQALGKRQEMPI